MWTRQLYAPYGALRYAYNPYGPAPTDYGYTGQRATDLGLMDYRARWYIPALGRFASADTIVPSPGAPQAFNRYSYAGNNPLVYIDPSGHYPGQPPMHDDEDGEPVEAPPPPVVVYIYNQMTSNAQGGTVQLLQSLNGACYSCAWDTLPDWTPGIGEGRSNAAYADTLTKLEAFAIFGWMVRQGGPWDPKPEIGDVFGYSQQIGSEWYYYDIWGNVMFGYLGAASGFSESELLEGAGAEQIGSGIGYTLLHRDLSFLPRREPGVDGLRAWDDPVDQGTAQIGIDLWNTYGLGVTPVDIVRAIEAASNIPTRNEPWE